MTFETIGPNSLSLIEYSYSPVISMPNSPAFSLNPAASDFPKSLLRVIIATRFSPIMSPNQLCAGAALHVTHEGSAEHIVARPGDVRVDCIGGDVGNAVLLEDGRRGPRGTGVAAGDSGRDLVLGGHLHREGRGLLGARLVVVDHELDRVAVDAARRVDLLDRELGADQCGVSVCRRKPGQRRVESDPDRVGQDQCGGRHRNGGAENEGPW